MKRSVSSFLAGVFALLVLPALLAPPVQADDPGVLAYSRVATSFSDEMWSAAFTGDDASLYFAENGSSGMRQISRTSLMSDGSPIPAAEDGFSSFRTSVMGWQNASIFAGTQPGKDGHSWIYSASGNCSVAAGTICNDQGAGKASGLWAIDKNNNSVSRIPLKRADGQNQDGVMFAVTGTPNGKYVYALSENPRNLFKIDALTNTQIGLGVAVPNFQWVYSLSADNDFVYSIFQDANYVKVAVDGASALDRTDSAAETFTALPQGATSYGVQDNYLISSSYEWRNGNECTTARGQIQIVNATTGASREVFLAAGVSPYDPRFGQDGYLYTFDVCSSKVLKVNPTTGQVEAQTPAFTNVRTTRQWGFSIMSHDKTMYVVGGGPTGGLIAVKTGLTKAEIATAAAAAELATRTISAKKSYSAKALAKRVGAVVSPNAKVTLKVAKASKKVCIKSGSKLKTKTIGNCVVTFTVQEPKPAAQKVTKSLVIGKAGSDSTWKAKDKYSISAVANSSNVSRTSKDKLTMTVSKSSKGICAKSGSSLKMLKPGTCKVTFTVQKPKPKATKTTKTFVVN